MKRPHTMYTVKIEILYSENKVCRQESTSMAKVANIHSKKFDEKIQRIRKGDRWQTVIGSGSTHESVVRDFSDCIFTNLVLATFSRTYMKKHSCSDCAQPSTDRCHGIGEDRPVLLKRAMARVWPDTTTPIVLKDIVIAFLEEHKSTSFTFKCHQCHLNERQKKK